MKTLLERAKPELKKAIATFKVDYPNTAERVEQVLSENYGLSFIPFGIVVDISSICRAANVEFDMNFPWAHFEDVK